MIQSEHKYICIGAYPCRGEKGVESTHYSMKAVSVQTRNILQKYLSGVENSFKEFASLEEKDMMEEAIQLIKPPLFSAGLKDVEGPVATIHNQQHRKSSIYGAIAAGKNVYLNIHCDKDFVTCATSVHVAKQYHVDENSVIYFAFPRLGICIPLRPGDILFFNPNEPHAVSSRKNGDNDVYCLSLYLKSSLMGLNDNSIRLSYEEKVLDQYVTTHCST